MYWFDILSAAICYFFFNWRFFCCTAYILEREKPCKRSLLWTFCLNYGVFFICSLFRWHLIVNWTIVLILFFCEMVFLLRRPAKECFLLAVMGTQLGLAVNIFFRSLIAIIMGIPLMYFDNSLAPGNVKLYPILCGFLISAAMFLWAERFDLLKGLNLIRKDKKNLSFLINVLVAIQLYLSLNLLVYYIKENNLVLKLWSMKSSIFVLIGECFSTICAIRMGQLSVYREENQKAIHLLEMEQAREKELWGVATTDPLTACQNRFQVEKSLEAALNNKKTFVFCFADLDSLKSVNDNLGHARGDDYLLAVSDALVQICKDGDTVFRYGGDEFVLLMYGITVTEARERLEQAQKRLKEESHTGKYPFSLSISYGFSTIADGNDCLSVIHAADGRMYQMKTSKHKQKEQ